MDPEQIVGAAILGGIVIGLLIVSLRVFFGIDLIG